MIVVFSIVDLVGDSNFTDYNVSLMLVIAVSALGQCLIIGSPGCVTFPPRGPVLFGWSIVFLG